MKQIFFLLLFLIVFEDTKAQEPAESVFPVKDSAIYYERIVTLDSTTKENIYKGVKSWGVNAFKSQKDVLQADDKEIGLIAYKYWFSEIYNAEFEGIKSSAEWKYNATMKIFIKDDKIKIVIQDIGLREGGPILTFKADYERVIKEMETSNKTYAKYSKKIYTPELKQKHFSEAKRNFEKANTSILSTIQSLVSYLKSGNSEFDF